MADSLSQLGATAQSGPSQWQYYWNPWWRQKRAYFTSLSVADCRRILTESTARFRLNRPIRRLMVSPAEFTLARVTTYHGRTGVKPVAYVKLREVLGRGTLVAVTLSGLRSGRVFWVVWFGFLALFAVLTSSSVSKNGAAGLIGPLFCGGLAAFGLLLNALGRRMARDDPAFLLGFLQERLRLTQPPAGIELLAQP